MVEQKTHFGIAFAGSFELSWTGHVCFPLAFAFVSIRLPCFYI